MPLTRSDIKSAFGRAWQYLVDRWQQRGMRRFLYVAVVLLSCLFIGVAIWRNWNELTQQQWKIDYRYVIAAIVLYPVGTLPAVAVWHTLLKALGVVKPFRTNLRLFVLSLLPRHIPGLVVYVTSRTMLYQDEDVPAPFTVAAMAAESGLLSLTGFILSGAFLWGNVELLTQYPWLRACFPLAVFGLLVIVALSPAVSRWIGSMLQRWQIRAEDVDRRELVWSLLWMFTAWSGGGFLLFLLAQAIAPMDWAMLPTMIGVWGIAGAVSLSIGVGIQGMGLREVTMGALLSTVMPPLAAVVLAVAFRLVITLGEFLWVILYVLALRRKIV